MKELEKEIIDSDMHRWGMNSTWQQTTIWWGKRKEGIFHSSSDNSSKKTLIPSSNWILIFS
jgi:hypothetical protein